MEAPIGIDAGIPAQETRGDRQDTGSEERRILFTYDAFDGLESLPQPGPVFIHADACPRYDEQGGFPDDLRVQRAPVSYGAVTNADLEGSESAL